VDVFAAAAVNWGTASLWHTWLESGQPAGFWENLGTPIPNQNIGGPPCAVSTGVNQLEVFVTGSDNSLWCLPYLPNPEISSSGPPADPSGYQWRGFQQLPGLGASSSGSDGLPVAITGGPDLVDIFCFAQSELLYFWKMNWREVGGRLLGKPPVIEYYSPSSTAPVQLPRVPPAGPTGGPNVYPCLPSAVTWGSKRLDVFWPDAGGTIRHLSWVPNTWDSETLPEGVTVQLYLA
jgi:hypothetical protein